MEYKVIVVSDEHESTAASKLDQEVKEYISNGWKPLGGASVSMSYTLCFDRTVLAQAMIKEV